MKNIIQNIVDLLFENMPFSRKTEEIKYKIENILENKYKNSEKDKSIEKLEDIFQDIDKLYQEAGYSEEEIKELSNYEGSIELKELKKKFKKYKRYLLWESFFIMRILSLLIGLISYGFIFTTILYNSFIMIIDGLLLFWIYKKEKSYLHKEGLLDIKYYHDGKEYMYSMYDKYVKKEINTLFLFIGYIAYILFICLISYVTAAYSWKDLLLLLYSQSTILGAIVFLYVKNMRFRSFLGCFFVNERNYQLCKCINKIVVFSNVYWMIVFLLLMLLRSVFTNIVNVFLIASVIYSIGVLIYNLTLRRDLVFKNIVYNSKRICVVSLCCILLGLYQVMSMDTWLTQSYINTVPTVQRKSDNIEYNDETGVYTITTAKEHFKILQLTDIHLGGSLFSVSKDLKALKAIETLITTTSPDLVVVTGDLVFPIGVMSFSLNNRAPVMQFASFMRNIGIPWVFTYGNHDTEAISVITDEQFDELMKSLSFRSSQNLLYPYVQPDIYGRSNQMIEIRHDDGSIIQALFLLDSNDYIPGDQLNEYDYIHDDQVAWYEKKVTDLSLQEGYTIPSMLFFHIPLQEYKEAYELYEENSAKVTYYYGEIGETMIDQICASKYPSALFDTAKKLGSTKAMFCGHDHYNNISLEYEGIRLTYGYSIDYLAMPGIEDDTKQRGATLITIDKNGDFEIEPYRLIDIK